MLSIIRSYLVLFKWLDVLVSEPMLPQYHAISSEPQIVSQNILAIGLQSSLSVLMHCKTSIAGLRNRFNVS